MLYAGAGLTLGGVALVAGLLPPYGPEASESEAPATALGIALLARLCLYPLGALVWEWSWALILAAIGAWAWGWLSSFLTADVAARLNRLAVAQRGFLLLALGLAFHEQGMVALFTALPAYGLAQMILSLSLRCLRRSASEVASIESLKGLARHNPWLGGPLLVGMLTLVGAPATLGFVGRVRILWAAQVTGMPWLVIMALLSSGLYSSSYLPLALMLFHKGTKERIPPVPPWPLRVAMALAALGLVVLGLYPLPLLRLALRVVEAGFMR
jgi:NADH-quinone oxidoreductase subunit N